jgi:dinuclear metal center YbgI/SA1388 family protein
MQRSELIAALTELLHPENYHDYGPNGLQVEGQDEIRHIVTGVSASLELIQKARLLGADTVMVHHGWFWKRDNPRITGVRKGRIAELLAADMNLIAYHLPLDDHPDLGNNALLGKALGFTPDGRFGEMNLGWIGESGGCGTARSLAMKIESVLRRRPLVVGDAERLVTRVAWCSGGAQDMLEDAYEAGADCFISGEISERTTLIARELGIPFLSCGHHATERFGIRALGEHVQKTFGIDVTFVDIDNPV